MIDLKNKSILFISPSFFGYEIAIKKRLSELAQKVDYFDERPANNFWSKALIRINRNFISHYISQYYESIYQKVRNCVYDYVLVVNIEAMPLSFLSRLRVLNPQATFILYMWDSIFYKKRTVDHLASFDRLFSFDQDDCEKYPMLKFRPLFFLNEYKDVAQCCDYEYDFSFIGTAHSDRYALIQKIQNQLKDMCLKSYWYLYLQDWKLFFWNKLTNSAFIKAQLHDFRYTPLSKDEVLEIVRKSKVVIDIQHPKQVGLTMRTIEMLGAQRKLVTTNASIRNYDFFQEDNILVIDRKKPQITESFVRKDYKILDDNIYFKYSLDGWLEDIFM